MTHQDEEKYSAKHPDGSSSRPEIAAAVKEQADGNRITCAAAHGIAAEHNISAAEVGKAIDLLEYRLIKCQLGLFGYSPERKIVKKAPQVTPELQQAIEGAATDNNKIACADCWKIAAAHGLPKMTVSSACETLGIKLGPCQLGAF